MADINQFDMQSDENSFMNPRLWDYADQMITPSYDLIPFHQEEDQMITPSYDLIPFHQEEDQMITSVDQPSSHNDFVIPAEQSTSVNLQTAYHDPNPSSDNSSLNITVADLENVFNFFAGDEYLSNLPIGYRFLPTDGELIVEYLKKLVNNDPLPPNEIYNVNVYDHSPEELSEIRGPNEDNEWYFFTPYKRKSRGGVRAERITPDGYWKATSGDKPVMHNGENVGNKKTLVYYQGKPGSAKKTNWIMHEYRLKDTPPHTDDMVVCRIHIHTRGNQSSE